MHGLKIGNKVKVNVKNGYLIGEVTDTYPEYLHIRTDEGITAYVPYTCKWEKIPSSKKLEHKKRPKHYGDAEFDLIDVWCATYTPEELRGAFKSQLSKYPYRLGYKDDEIDELDKIIDYSTRYRDHLKKVAETNEK
ncbi:DUF3310 domain-containing protein [Staphylococcus sp. IVB6246]|uniref:DUF3310 domain-containing protein n=1 Tax=Staphylococcus sp. IVB6246 TaxID=2989772 RepID=UPI0021D126A8|nr:DUF3310 domain-containing protein [Staphylococcus sp. IVB6246]UXR70279.1 DUF3310 domain-containing protein [Staphylococcus sp. IVB6246]